LETARWKTLGTRCLDNFTSFYTVKTEVKTRV